MQPLLEQLRAIGDPVARERAVRDHLGQVPELAAIRRETLWELHAKLGSWRKVGDAIGISGQSAHKAARS